MPVKPALKEQVSSGLWWGAGARVTSQVMAFGFSVVLARLLSPGDYGLMAMVMVFTGFAGMLADAGFGQALVQKPDLSDLHISTVFWLTVGSGALLTALTCLLAPWLAEFYHAPVLRPLFQAVAVNFTLASLGSVQYALLQKRMQFRVLARIDISATVVSGVVGVVLAVRGAGVWTLVAQALVMSGLTSLLRWSCCGWTPKFRFSFPVLKEMWQYASHLYGFNFINYWARNGDNLVVGKFFGAPTLGAYNRAYALMLLPISQISSVVSQVTFPALSGIQDDRERVKRIYLRAIGLVALLGFPIMLGLLVVAEPFVLTIYGAKWGQVAVLLQILALVGAVQILANSTGWLYLSQGRTDVMFFWGTISALAALASFAVGVWFGSVYAVACCYAVMNFTFLYPTLAAAGGIVNLKAGTILAAVSGPFLCSVAMAVVVAGVHFLLPPGWRPWLTLTVLVSAGVAVYGLLVHFLKLASWVEFSQIIREKYGG